jgi:sulfite exporter TauE/SafE
VFVVGLAGSMHCAGMCGGIVGAVVGGPAMNARTPQHGAAPERARVVSYNAGRIGSYMVAGALAGGLAGGARSMASLAGVQLGFYWLANAMLVALGLYLMNAWRGLAVLEQAAVRCGATSPRRQNLHAGRHTPANAFALGAVGLAACGMVYSVLPPRC